MITTLNKNNIEHQKVDVRNMFDGIAKSYDFLNHFLSLGIDKYWRNVTVKTLQKSNPSSILDIATGTADLAISTAERLNKVKITGVDISEQMLAIGKQKVIKCNLTHRIELLNADAMALPFNDEVFDAVTIGFGIRNFPEINGSLKEIYRVLKGNGLLCILEFSKPKNYIIRNVYNFYFSKILPFVGNKLSKHKYAYKYLNKSVSEFPEGKAFNEFLRLNGFVNIENKPLTFGISTLYISKKPTLTK